jgi:hypothetical protein
MPSRLVRRQLDRQLSDVGTGKAVVSGGAHGGLDYAYSGHADGVGLSIETASAVLTPAALLRLAEQASAAVASALFQPVPSITLDRSGEAPATPGVHQ